MHGSKFLFNNPFSLIFIFFLTPIPFNPKIHGLFGQLNTWGGGRILPFLEKRSVTPPNCILEQQTVSHMKAEVFS
jgi:hypothetical protein